MASVILILNSGKQMAFSLPTSVVGTDRYRKTVMKPKMILA